jgi:hypothetical protein
MMKLALEFDNEMLMGGPVGGGGGVAAGERRIVAAGPELAWMTRRRSIVYCSALQRLYASELLYCTDIDFRNISHKQWLRAICMCPSKLEIFGRQLREFE